MTLSCDELTRYSRHLALSEVGREGQERLKAASVLVVGAGGLGCPALMYLAAAGVGRIRIVDFDCVDASNLQRQVLFCQGDVGAPKALAAAKALSAQNPLITIEPFVERFAASNALSHLEQCDIVVDGTDNFATRYLINDACVVAQKPFVSGALERFSGQVGVFNLRALDGTLGPTYRCLFPAPPAPEDAPSCAEAGVLGVLPGIIGTLQAAEVLKIILGLGDILSGRMLLCDALSMHWRTLAVRRNEAVVLSTKLLTDSEYAFFCNGARMVQIPQITPKELHERLQKGEAITLIDVREPDEREIANIGGELIPMNTVLDNLSKVPHTGTVVVYCRSGGRSQRVCEALAKEHGYTNLMNLRGGVLGWAEEVDPSLQRY
ncbi:MAG: molybdopterin-synthase adenylyltransferase MoeB [Proteobacteria bacterium]|nr:molybdopterin-synthase adenylyltransferase MoeB [Pseudomonadota bacterium]